MRTISIFFGIQEFHEDVIVDDLATTRAIPLNLDPFQWPTMRHGPNLQHPSGEYEAPLSNSSSSIILFKMQQIETLSSKIKMNYQDEQMRNEIESLGGLTFSYSPVGNQFPHPPLYDENEPLTEKETEVTKDKVLPSTQDIQPPVIQKSQDPVKPVSSPISPEPSSAQVDNSPPSKESSKETKLPYPSRVECEKKGENDKVAKYKSLGNELILLSSSGSGASINSHDLGPIWKKLGTSDLKITRDELDKEILIPIPRESKIGKDCDFPSCDDFQSFKTFLNPLFEKQDIDESILKEVHTETFKSYLNPLFEDDEEIISNEASSIISPKVDVKTIVSFFAPIGNFARKWATSEFEKDNVEVNHEVFKSDSENSLGIHDDKEEEIAFLDGLLEDENFFEMNDKKDESFERKTKEDFETKVEPEKKKELQVFHPNIETLNHLETTSYVGSDYVFYEDFNLVDMIFPMNIQGKIFDPGITFHGKSFEKDVFNDKSSKELAPLMDFHVTKAFFGFSFSILKNFSKKFSGFWKLHGSILWKDKAMPTISINDLQSSLHNWGNSNIELTSILLARP
ncbi:hypothetical protein Tco_1072864 [Tanacetum coccineum]